MEWSTLALLIGAALMAAYFNAQIRALKNALAISANAIDRLEAKVDQISGAGARLR